MHLLWIPTRHALRDAGLWIATPTGVKRRADFKNSAADGFCLLRDKACGRLAMGNWYAKLHWLTSSQWHPILASAF